jgi:hypothetical protein
MATAAQRFAADRAKFPGMQIDEILVWKAFLAVYQGSYDRFDYNMRLGPGITPPPSLEEPYASMSVKLSQLRLDAVGWQGGNPTIFEVERYAKPRNVGQLLTYRAAWDDAAVSSVEPHLALVVAAYNPSILPVLEQQQIDLYEFPVDFSALAPARVKPT